MYSQDFAYELPDHGVVTVRAKCKAFVGGEVCELQLTFIDKDTNEILKVKYDKEIFKDIEDIAVGCLTDGYYNQDAYEFITNTVH